MDIHDEDIYEDEYHNQVAQLNPAEEHNPHHLSRDRLSIPTIEALQEPSSLEELILTTYRDVWTQFYEWDARYWKDMTGVLAHSVVDEENDEEWFPTSESCHKDEAEDSDMHVSSAVSFSIWENESSYRPSSTRKLSCKVVSLGEFEPHPPYYACTPIDCSIWLSEEDTFSLRFIKYAGEEDFNEKNYMKNWTRIFWQENTLLRDPDVYVIMWSVLERLSRPGAIPRSIETGNDEEEIVTGGLQNLLDDPFSVASIDMTEVLPVSVSEVLYHIQQRDTLLWAQSSLAGSSRPIKSSLCPKPDDIIKRLDSMARTFCPSLDCLRVECFVHYAPNGWRAIRDETEVPVMPMLSSTDLTSSSGEPCGESCFLQDDVINQIIPTRRRILEDTDTIIPYLDDFLKIEPDGLPCNIAAMTRIPCVEVYARRCVLLPDNETEMRKEQAQQRKNAKKAKRLIAPQYTEFADIKNYAQINYTPQTRCDHDGPCSLKAGCGCVQKNMRCRRNCTCDPDCERRYRGCRCPDSQCSAEECECSKQGWECDPELCGLSYQSKKNRRKGRRVTQKIHMCKNTMMQRECKHMIEIKPSHFGLGAFATSNIPAAAYIGDYFASGMKTDEAYILNDGFSEFNGLNYSFTLNHTQVLDAIDAGNETRFINHPSERLGQEANVDADTKLVHGEHRIGFYTSRVVKAGEELLFDYGEGYWRNMEPG